jgi:signal peptidase I
MKNERPTRAKNKDQPNGGGQGVLTRLAGLTKSRTASGKATGSRNIRETVESIAIAFILAFLFRTFEAEAFVIPTGSMAPTLQGRHKDLTCPQCGFRYQAGASDVNDHPADIVAATCPMCRFTVSIDSRRPGGIDAPTYNGDRILVGKFIYEFSDPERWDVIVFHFPGDAKMNYIKRLVGLPKEELAIHRGDVFVRPLKSEQPFKIARKPPDKLRAISQLVHDNNYIPADYLKSNWPLRWHVWPPREAADAGGWSERRELVEVQGVEKVRQRFAIAGRAAETRWIRYRHIIPSAADWERVLQGPPLPPDYEGARPQLITDFYAYNTSLERGEDLVPPGRLPASKFGLHWVGDLMLQADLQVTTDAGEVLLDLVEGGRHFTAAIDVATGEAQLKIEGQAGFAPTAQTAVRGPGEYRLGLSNFDNQLLLWIDGEPVEFSAPTTYPNPEFLIPTVEELAPAGVGARGAGVEVRDLRVYRDIYYIADYNRPAHNRPLSDYPDRRGPLADYSRQHLARFLADPRQWDVFGERIRTDYTLQADQFLVLGDNSPFSKDSRLWEGDTFNGHALSYFVDRKLLIGKALFIYWPHSWDRVPGTSIPFPYFPNVQDMGLVR